MKASDRQRDLYIAGAAGLKPVVPIDFALLEEAAKNKISAEAFAYIAGGAGQELTMHRNREAFNDWRIVPRMLRDVGERDTSINLFGKQLASPFLLSPIGVLEMAHAQADIAVAKAASSLAVPYIFSNQASVAMEKTAAAMGNTPFWMQLYWSKSDDLVKSFAQRAERCGASAIVVTLDTTLLGWRTRDLDLAYLPFLRGKGIAQYTSDPVFQRLMDEPDTTPAPKRKLSMSSLKTLMDMTQNYPEGGGFLSKLSSGRPLKAVRKFVEIYSRPTLTWDNLAFLREQTKLSILLKGILHPDDARKALDYGMDGIVISNHGGRQVDGSVSTIEMLPLITEVIQGKIPVLIDSGIRTGADAFKCLALGANAVCIGRPYVYGLAAAGELGVREVLLNFMADFELTMGLAGCKNIAEIKRDCLK